MSLMYRRTPLVKLLLEVGLCEALLGSCCGTTNTTTTTPATATVLLRSWRITCGCGLLLILLLLLLLGMHILGSGSLCVGLG